MKSTDDYKLSKNKILLFFISLKDFQSSYFLKLLDEVERKKAQAFYFEKDREQFVVVRGLLKTLTSKILNIKNTYISITYNENGKPLLKVKGSVSPLVFNVSHSHDYAYIALALEDELGVDIEKVDSERKWKEILEKNFTKKEKKYVFSISQEEEQRRRFYQLWTLKEAIVKCEGQGLFKSLEEIELATESLISSQKSNYRDLSLFSFVSPDKNYLGALATTNKSAFVEVYELKAEDQSQLFSL